MDNMYSDAVNYQRVLDCAKERGFNTAGELIEAYDRMKAEEQSKVPASTILKEREV